MVSCFAIAVIAMLGAADDPQGKAGVDFDTFSVSKLTCVIGNNLGNAPHRNRYNGIFSMSSPDEPASPFVPFYAGAWRDLRRGRVGMDVPVALGIVIAFTASAAATWSGSGTVYFDSVSMFVFLLLGARFLEMEARAKAVRTQEQLVRLCARRC